MHCWCEIIIAKNNVMSGSMLGACIPSTVVAQGISSRKILIPNTPWFNKFREWKSSFSLSCNLGKTSSIMPCLIYSEMPTSGDLKSGDWLFFTTPPEFQRPPPKWNDLGHYMMSYMMYTLSKFEIIVLMLEIIFVND